MSDSWQLVASLNDTLLTHTFHYPPCQLPTLDGSLTPIPFHCQQHTSLLDPSHLLKTQLAFQSNRSSAISSFGFFSLAAVTIPRPRGPHPEMTTVSENWMSPSSMAWIEQARGSTNTAFHAGMDLGTCNERIGRRDFVCTARLAQFCLSGCIHWLAQFCLSGCIHWLAQFCLSGCIHWLDQFCLSGCIHWLAQFCLSECIHWLAQFCLSECIHWLAQFCLSGCIHWLGSFFNRDLMVCTFQ